MISLTYSTTNIKYTGFSIGFYRDRTQKSEALLKRQKEVVTMV